MKDVHTYTPAHPDVNAPQGVAELDLLIKLSKANDRKAQQKLYDRYAPILYAKIRRYVYDASSAGEILNDSFFKILTNLDSFSATGSFEGWMHRITVNTIMDYMRKKIKPGQITYPGTEDYEVPVPETTIGKLAYKEMLTLIHTLPDVHRSVFNLFIFENYSHKEIAAYLDITENNSRWHLNDARRRLKGKIDALK